VSGFSTPEGLALPHGQRAPAACAAQGEHVLDAQRAADLHAAYIFLLALENPNPDLGGPAGGPAAGRPEGGALACAPPRLRGRRGGSRGGLARGRVRLPQGRRGAGVPGSGRAPAGSGCAPSRRSLKAEKTPRTGTSPALPRCRHDRIAVCRCDDVYAPSSWLRWSR